MKNTIYAKLQEREAPAVSSCVLYAGFIGNAGYGLAYCSVRRKTVSAHRLAYEKAYGEIEKGNVIMHICDNTTCINPKHLVSGTQSDNIKDCIKKGRYNYRHKLTREQQMEIQKDNRSSRKIAEDYGINQKTLLNIKNRDISGKGGSCGV